MTRLRFRLSGSQNLLGCPIYLPCWHSVSDVSILIQYYNKAIGVDSILISYSATRPAVSFSQTPSTTTIRKGSPLMDRKIDETTTSLTTSFAKQAGMPLESDFTWVF